MNASVTVYFNTGFNGIDIPASPAVLETAAKKTYADVFYIREDIDKPSIRIKDSYENLCAVDYCAITTSRGTSYFFASPSALTKGVTVLALDLDALLTMGGAANLNYISGWQERGHIKKTDDVLFSNIAAEDWVPSQPLLNANMTEVHGNSNSAEVLEDLNLVTSNVDFASITDPSLPSDEQLVYAGVHNGETKMFWPKIPAALSTSYSMYDFDISNTREFAVAQTRVYAIKDYRQQGNPDIPRAKEALERLFSAGQLQLQNSYIIPKEYIESTTFSSLTGDVGHITGFHELKNLANMPYEYTIPGYTIKNKKVFTTFRQYAIVCVASGDTIIKSAEDIYNSGDINPSIKLWADPSSTGKPYARFAYVKGAPYQFADCVKGLQWANNQLVMEGASGSLWNSIDNAFANQQIQRQQSMNLFNAGVAARGYDLASQQANANLDYSYINSGISAIGSIGEGINTHFARDAKGGPLNELQLGKGIANASLGIAKSLAGAAQATTNNTIELQRLYNEMSATASRAEMENNTLQNQINQNNIGLIRSNNIVAPTVMFTPEQNLGLYGYNYFVAYEIRKSDDDLKSEDMYYQRYGYNGLHRPLTAQCFNERQYYNYVQAFDVNIKNSTAQFGLRVRTKAIAQLNKGVRVWKVLPDASYYETN